MTLVFLIGRVLFALYWLDNAKHHLLHADSMVGYAQSKGVKSPKMAIIGTGVLLLLGGLSILLGAFTTVGIILLIIFLLGVSFKMHAFWKETDPMAKMGARVDFMKNMALLAALLMMFANSNQWAYSLFHF